MALSIQNLKVSVSVNQSKADGGEGGSKPISERQPKKGDSEKLTKDVLEQLVQIMNNKNER